MKTNYRYEQIIKEKLDNHAAPDVNDLWSKMNQVLDVEMPVVKSKRPATVAVFNPKNAVLLVGALIISAIFIAQNFSSFNKNDQIFNTNTEAISNEKNNSTSDQTNLNTDIAPGVITNNNVYNRNVNTSKSKQLSAYTNNISEGVTNAATQSFLLDNASENISGSENIITGTKNTISKIDGTIAGSTLNINSLSEKNETPFMAKKPTIIRQNAWMKNLVAGVSFNFNAPVGSQNLNFFNSSNKKGIIYDYMPSVHLQYHISNKLYVQAEVQPIAPQYASNNILYKKTTHLNPDEKEEDLFRLNKSYYLNLPVSVHFRPTEQVSVGAGVQYSKLKQLVLSNEKIYSIKSGSGYNNTLLSKETIVRAAPTAEDKANMITAADSVVNSFKTNDVRLFVDAGYQVNKINIGVKYTAGMNSFYNEKSSPEVIPSAGKNASLQLYFRVNIFGKKK
ncbi:MAG TPA: hypothetical protein VM368_02285 [Flavisolibacter sp.]|nr:hypothetical protein [Flavisolibacter sp.]